MFSMLRKQNISEKANLDNGNYETFFMGIIYVLNYQVLVSVTLIITMKLW